MNEPGYASADLYAHTRRWTAICLALLLILLLIGRLESNSSSVLRWTDVLFWVLLYLPHLLVVLLLRPGARFAAGAALSLNATTMLLFTFFSLLPFYGVPMLILLVLKSPLYLLWFVPFAVSNVLALRASIRLVRTQPRPRFVLGLGMLLPFLAMGAAAGSKNIAENYWKALGWQQSHKQSVQDQQRSTDYSWEILPHPETLWTRSLGRLQNGPLPLNPPVIDGSIVAVTANGKTWRFNAAGSVLDSVAAQPAQLTNRQADTIAHLQNGGTAVLRGDSITAITADGRRFTTLLGPGLLTPLKYAEGTLYIAGHRRVYAFDDELRLKWLADLAAHHQDLGTGLTLLYADAQGVVLSDEGDHVFAVADGTLSWITDAMSPGSTILAAARAPNRNVYFTVSGPAGFNLHAVRPRHY